MKAPYFTRDSIRQNSRAYLRQLEKERKLRLKELRSREAALLVVDMQRYFLEPQSHAFLPSAPAIVPGIRELVRVFCAAERPVIFTRHLNTEENAGMMGRWWQDIIRRESPFSTISPELDISGAWVLEKTQYDAFHGTSLQTGLEEQGVRQLLITGVMTHLCCESTARAAFVLGFEPFVTVDGCATASEELHIGSLRSLGHGFASLVTVEDVARAMEGEQ